MKLFTVLFLIADINFSISAQSTDGSVAYYPFNGNANDEASKLTTSKGELK